MQPFPSDQQALYLKNLSLTEYTPMQQAVIQRSESGADLMLLAPTGSGKTLAFLVPLVSRLTTASQVQALIIAPSRELALQIEQVFRGMKTSFKVSCCYGGHSMKIEQNSLSEAPAVIIGTPGRLADHLLRKSFDPSKIRTLILDEFDKSLQLGYAEQLKAILKALSGRQQHILTSATRLEEMPDFLILKRPEVITYLREEAEIKLSLKVVHTTSVDKVETLMRLVASFQQDVSLIFCNHREAVERISTLFRAHHFEHGILHGAMEQMDREKNLIKFRCGANHVLIATDLASRGLDIPEIRHIVHYQLPPQREAFTHRNGRTARMHAEGDAYLILANDETLPGYIDKDVAEVKVPSRLVLPPPPPFACLYFGAGKKDKISKGDIVGLLTRKGGLAAGDIGLVTTLDHQSYASVRRSEVKKVLEKIKHEKLKKSKVKIELAS